MKVTHCTHSQFYRNFQALTGVTSERPRESKADSFPWTCNIQWNAGRLTRSTVGIKLPGGNLAISRHIRPDDHQHNIVFFFSSMTLAVPREARPLRTRRVIVQSSRGSELAGMGTGRDTEGSAPRLRRHECERWRSWSGSCGLS